MDKKTLLGAAAALLAAAAAFLGFTLFGGGDPEPPAVIRQSEPGAWYEIYFTNPTCPPAEARQGGLDETIAGDIRRAAVRVDVAAFDLDSEPILEALAEIRARGLAVRVVVDDEYTPPETIDRLRRLGLNPAGDGRSALMHNKFILVDGRVVWTGSLNYTSSGVYCNNNNAVRFDDPRLAANYAAEMDEMAADRLFGPGSPVNTVDRLAIQGAAVENYFAAEDALAPIIARVLARADREILFMAFSFTNEDIGEALLERARAGLVVRGVFETTGAATRFSYFGRLRDAGFPNVRVRTDGNPRVMHHKVFIVDRETVIFGSYNFTGSAETANDENLIIVHDPTFAGYFVEEFETVWSEAGGS